MSTNMNTNINSRTTTASDSFPFLSASRSSSTNSLEDSSTSSSSSSFQSEIEDENAKSNDKHDDLQSPYETMRRTFLEQLAVITYVFAFVFAPFVSLALTLFVVFTPVLWFIAVPYFVWYVYDFHAPRRGSRTWPAFRRLKFWRHLAAYFPMRLVKTAELPPDRNYVIGVHPHGIIGFATYVTFCTEGTGFSRLFPGLRRFPVTLPLQFWFPIRREFLTFSGTISSDRSAIEYVLERPPRGYTVGIVPGGAAESLDSQPHSYALTLARRRGFIRLAIKHGADLVPMYHFGENCVYDQVPNPPGSRLRRFQMAVKRWTGATVPFFYGRDLLGHLVGLMPYRKPITTVVGAPIPVRYNPKPSEKEIDAVHSEYCAALKRLFDEHKGKYGEDPEAELTFV